jgi:hypothetical protein
VSTIRMGMARLLASCRARMICIGFTDFGATSHAPDGAPPGRVASVCYRTLRSAR